MPMNADKAIAFIGVCWGESVAGDFVTASRFRASESGASQVRRGGGEIVAQRGGFKRWQYLAGLEICVTGGKARPAVGR
jgi:hypothetical protein